MTMGFQDLPALKSTATAQQMGSVVSTTLALATLVGLDPLVLNHLAPVPVMVTASVSSHPLVSVTLSGEVPPACNPCVSVPCMASVWLQGFVLVLQDSLVPLAVTRNVLRIVFCLVVYVLPGESACVKKVTLDSPVLNQHARRVALGMVLVLVMNKVVSAALDSKALVVKPQCAPSVYMVLVLLQECACVMKATMGLVARSQHA